MKEPPLDSQRVWFGHHVRCRNQAKVFGQHGLSPWTLGATADDPLIVVGGRHSLEQSRSFLRCSDSCDPGEKHPDLGV